jgi:two-component system, NarL family, response regulator YdfI
MTAAGRPPATILVLADDELRAARIESTLRSDGRWCVKVGRLADSTARIAADGPDAIVLVAPPERAARLLEALTASSPPVMLLAPGGPEDWTSKRRAPNLRAVLREDAMAKELQAALAAVLAGLVVRHPQTAAAAPTTASSRSGSVLTARELEILEMMAEGIDNRRIALRLGISRNTVKFHVASILDKLRASSRTEAVTIAIREGRISV